MHGGLAAPNRREFVVQSDPDLASENWRQSYMLNVTPSNFNTCRFFVSQIFGQSMGADFLARPPRLSKEELADRIIENGWREQRAVTAAALQDKNEDPTFYNTLLHMGRKELHEFMSWVWDLHGLSLQEEVAVDRIARLHEAAESGACTCDGKWIPAAEQVLQHQHLSSKDFRQAVLAALRLGRRKGINVLIIGKPDAGKSFALKPLGLIFKTFDASGQKETYSLQGLPGSEIALLQDVRYESFGLPWDDWLRWGEGERVKIRLPRNHFLESFVYKGTAPLFATMATPFHYPLDEARRTCRDIEYENQQFRSRWNTINFPNSIPEEQRDSTLDPCTKCCALWYVGALSSQSAEAGVSTPFSIQPADSKRPRIDGSAASFARFQQMESIMQWFQSGLLSASEFEKAKKDLGL